MVVARQEWLDWEFEPPGFSQYGCDDIGDLVASGQMSVEFLDDDDEYRLTEAELEESRLRHRDAIEIRAQLRKTMPYRDKETEDRYEERIGVEVSLQVYRREIQRARERDERGMPSLSYVPGSF